MLVPMSTFIGATMSVIAFVGFVGNFFTLFVILRYRPLHDVTGMFLANLALADLLQSSFGMPLVASSAFHNQWQFGDSLCTLSGLTNSLFCITSMLTLAAISLDRCFAIVFPLNHFSLLTAKRAGVALVYIWTHAFLIALFPVFGWSRYVYLSYEFICTVQWESNRAYTIFLSLSSFALPLIVTVLSYASVMRVACHQAHETPQLTVGQFERKVTSDGAKENPFVLDVNELMKVEDKQENASLSERRYEKQELELSVMCNVTKKNKAEDDVENSKSVWRDQRLQKQRKRTNVEKEVALDIEQPSEEIILPSLEQRSSSNDALLALRKALECQYADQVLNKVPCPEVSRTNEDSSRDESVMQGDPASESSRLDTKVLSEDPEMCRLRKAWKDVDSSESDLGKTVKEGEKEVLRREGLEPDSTPSNTRLHVGHFARLREWMFLKRTSKEMTDAVLHRKKEMKVVLTLAVVNGTFILCWLPHFIGITCLTFTNGSRPFSDTFFAVTTTLAMLNSGCNPFIYTLTYRKFRKAFQNVLPCFRSSRIRNT